MRFAMIPMLAVSLALALASGEARAEPGSTDTSSGSAAAEVIAMGSITRQADLRFGAFPAPAANATMTINPNGSVTATGELPTTMNYFASADGRGPARFRIQGSNNRAFLPFLPNQIVITSGTNSMIVDRLRHNILGAGLLDANGRFIYYVGGRLNVGANQAAGNYRGEYTLTVLFL